MAHSDFDLESGLLKPAVFALGLQLIPTILEENVADDELPAQDPVHANPLDIPSAVSVSAETSNVSPIPLQEEQSNIETNPELILLAFQQWEQEIFGTSNQQMYTVFSRESPELPPEDSDTDSEAESFEQDMMEVDSSVEENMMTVDNMERNTVIPGHSVGARLQLKVSIQEDSKQVEPVIRASVSEASGAANNITESVLPDHQAPISSPAGMPPMDYRFTDELSSQIDSKGDAEVPVSLAMFPASDHGTSVSVKNAADNGNATQLDRNHQ